MGFLSNLLKQAEAQINMRDGGKTAATVRQQQQRPQAAQLPSPGQRPPTNRANREYNSGAEQLQMPHLSNPIPSLHNFATQSFAQLNPLDGGRTWKHAVPTNDASLIHQATHNGATNTVGTMVAKPFLINPAQNVVETGRAITAEATHNLLALKASQQREMQNIQNSLPMAIAKPLYNAGKANTVDLAKEVAAGLTGNKIAEQNANNAYMRDINASPIGGLLNIPQRKMAAAQVHRDLPKLNAKQQKQAIANSLESTGIDPKASGAAQALQTGISALQLAAPTFGIAKAGIEGTTAGQYLRGATMFDMAKTGAKAVGNISKNQTGAVKDLAQGVKNPHPDVTPEDYMSLRRVTNHAQGGPEIDRPVSAGDLVATRSLLKQKGYDPNDLSAADHIVNQISGYEAKKQAIQGGYVQDPFRAAMDKSKQLVGQYQRVANQGEQLANQVDRAHNIAHSGNGTSSEQMALGKFMNQRLGLKSLDDSGHIQISRDGQPDAYYNKLGALSDKMKATQGTPAWNKHALAADKLMRQQDHIDGNTPLPVETPPQIPKTQLNKNGRPTIKTKAADAAKAGLADMQAPEPQTLYHGAATKFDQFDPAKVGSGEGANPYGGSQNLFGDGAYLTDSKQAADKYAHNAAKQKYTTGYKEDGALSGYQYAPNADELAAKNKVINEFKHSGKVFDAGSDTVTPELADVIASHVPGGLPKSEMIKEINRSLEVTRSGQYHNSRGELTNLLARFPGKEVAQAVKKHLQGKGYDGVKYPAGDFEGIKANNYVIYNADKLKSAAKGIASDQAGSPGVRGVVQKLAKPFKSDAGYGLGADDGSLVPHIRDAAKKLAGGKQSDAALLQSEQARIAQGNMTGDDYFIKQKIQAAKTPQQVKETADYIRMSQQRAATAAAEEAKQPFKSGIRRDLYNQAKNNPGMDIGRAAYDWRSNNSTGLISDRTMESHIQAVKDALNKDATAPEAPAAKPAVQSQPKAAPTKVPGEQAGGIAPGNSTPQVVQNSLTKGAKEGRQNISDETIAQTSGEHTVRNTQKLADDSQKAVDSVPINTAVETAHGMLAQPLGHVSDEQTGYIAKAIERADAEATQARAAGNHVEADRLTRESSALHDGLSEHAVARGQANQALTMMYNKSPQGLFYGAIRDLKKAGVKDTPELRAKLQPLIDAVKTAKGEAEKADALANFHQAVSQTMPQNIGDKAIGIWKAGLLSGVKTQQGNAISNAVFAGLKKVSDVPATVVDSLMSVFTGERTKTATGTGGLRGTVEGASNGAHTMKTGVDRRNAGDKYEQHAEINFKHPALNKTLGTAVRTVFRGMNAADQPFWYGAFKNSMYDQAKADGINKGLGGQALRDHMDNLVANPTDKMANTALTEANKSTLNYDTLASKAIQAIHTGIDKVQSLNGRPVPQQARTIAHNVIHVLAPFVRVPTAFLSRTVDFTPLGMGKEVMQQVFTKQFDQRALSQAIGEGMTGTGAIALGIALTHNNLLSGDYPKNNPKEAQRWKAEGIQPNSVKIYRGKDANGKNRYTWISLNYMGPLGMLFGAGNKLATSDSPSALAKVGVAVGGMGQSLMGQSFLQGFSGFSDAIQDPNRNLKSFVNSQAGSVVPSIVNDVANATDSMQRQADNMGEAIKNRIPGLREQQNAKQDVYGNPLKQPAGPLGTLLGFKPSNDLTVNNPVTTEVGRLHMVDPSNSDMAVTPMPVSGTITAEKQKITLTDKQRYDLQKQVGQTTQTAWGKLIATPEYRAMNDQQKAKALTDIRGKASEDAQRAYVVANNLGTYNKPESKGADKVSQGDVVGALSKSKGSGSTTTADYNSKPDAQYKAALDSYNKNKSTMNDAQRIKAETSLHKLEIGSKYDKNVRDLYGMSKAQAYNYVSKSPNGKAIADQLTAYDNALYDAGLTSYRKYSNGIAPAAKKTSSGTRKSSGSRASSNSPTKALASYAKFGSSNAFKYENSLRGLVAKTLKAPKVKGTNQTARVKKYKAPSVKIATNPKPRKAFA